VGGATAYDINFYCIAVTAAQCCATMHFADLVLVVPGTAAYLTIADLVQD